VKSTRNLIMVYGRGRLDPRDFEAIRTKIETRAPDIRVFIVQDSHLALATKKKAATLPTLVFAPIALQWFRPARGKVYCGRAISKVEQMQRLDAAGIPVPKWMLLTAETKLDPDEWGPYVIIKPSAFVAASLGRGVEVKRTEEVIYQDPKDFPEDHPGRKGPMIVQRYIDTGQEIQGHRLATLFGRTLYANVNMYLERRPRISDVPDLREFRYFAVEDIGEVIKRRYFDDPDILALGSKINACFPEVPLQSIDILREEATRRLFVLEINPGGNTWHFSSYAAERQRRTLGGLRLEDQFQAFDVAADVLIEKTRAEAE
jgi:hypothetical protein